MIKGEFKVNDQFLLVKFRKNSIVDADGFKSTNVKTFSPTADIVEMGQNMCEASKGAKAVICSQVAKFCVEYNGSDHYVVHERDVRLWLQE